MNTSPGAPTTSLSKTLAPQSETHTTVLFSTTDILSNWSLFTAPNPPMFQIQISDFCFGFLHLMFKLFREQTSDIWLRLNTDVRVCSSTNEYQNTKISQRWMHSHRISLIVFVVIHSMCFIQLITSFSKLGRKKMHLFYYCKPAVDISRHVWTSVEW